MVSFELQVEVIYYLLFIYLLLRYLSWPPYVIGQAIIFSSCGFFFFLISIYLSFSPRLISAVVDCMSAVLPLMVWP